MLGTSDAWSMRRSSHRPSDPAYYIEDFRIYWGNGQNLKSWIAIPMFLGLKVFLYLSQKSLMAKLFTKILCPLGHMPWGLSKLYKEKNGKYKGTTISNSLKVTPILVTSYDVKNILTVSMWCTQYQFMNTISDTVFPRIVSAETILFWI